MSNNAIRATHCWQIALAGCAAGIIGLMLLVSAFSGSRATYTMTLRYHHGQALMIRLGRNARCAPLSLCAPTKLGGITIWHVDDQHAVRAASHWQGIPDLSQTLLFALP